MTEAPAQPYIEVTGDDVAVVEDYWGTDERIKHFLPDGKQWFEIKVMNEGEKAKYQKQTSKDLRVQGRTGDAIVSVDPAGERHSLIQTCVTDWYLFRGGQPVRFDKNALLNWLQVAPPKLVEKLEFAIRMANPWMQSDMTIEQIDESIADLEKMRAEKEREKLGEAPSSDS